MSYNFLFVYVPAGATFLLTNKKVKEVNFSLSVLFTWLAEKIADIK